MQLKVVSLQQNLDNVSIYLLVVSSFSLQACTLARRTAESFLKYVNRNLHTLGTQMKFRSPEGHVKGVL